MGTSSVIAVSEVRRGFSFLRGPSEPGSHIHDHQMRLFMKLRLTKTLPAAAAQAGISVASAYRFHCRRRCPATNRPVMYPNVMIGPRVMPAPG